MKRLFLLLAISTSAFAAPPPNSDGRYKGFFESLRDKDGMLCCSVSDCRTVAFRTVGNGYEVFIDEQFPEGRGVGWAAVPTSAVLPPRDNPLGEALACWIPTRGVICFLRATEA